jgi:hypothetical protein
MMQIDIGERRPYTFEIRLAFLKMPEIEKVEADLMPPHPCRLMICPYQQFPFLLPHNSHPKLFHQVDDSVQRLVSEDKLTSAFTYAHEMFALVCLLLLVSSIASFDQAPVDNKFDISIHLQAEECPFKEAYALTFQRVPLLRDVWLKVEPPPSYLPSLTDLPSHYRSVHRISILSAAY